MDLFLSILCPPTVVFIHASVEKEAGKGTRQGAQKGKALAE